MLLTKYWGTSAKLGTCTVKQSATGCHGVRKFAREFHVDELCKVLQSRENYATDIPVNC